MKASTVNDLIVVSEDRRISWQALRERSLQRDRYQVNDIPEEVLSDEMIAILLGISQEKKE